VKGEANVPAKSNKQKNLGKKLNFCWHLEGHRRKEQDPELDLLVGLALFVKVILALDGFWFSVHFRPI
jgi:hypothetical protein